MGLPGCEPSQGSTLLFPLAALDLLWRGLCGQPIGDYVNNPSFFRSSPIRLSTALSMASFGVAKFCAHLCSGMLTMLRRARSASSKSFRASNLSRNTRTLRVPGPSLSSVITNIPGTSPMRVCLPKNISWKDSKVTGEVRMKGALS